MSDKVLIFKTRRRDYNQRDSTYGVFILCFLVYLMFFGLTIWVKLSAIPLIIGWLYLWNLGISKVTIQDDGIYLHRLFKTEKIGPPNVVKIYFNPQISIESPIRLIVKRSNGKKKNLALCGEFFEYKELLNNFSQIYKIDPQILNKLKNNKVTW